MPNEEKILFNDFWIYPLYIILASAMTSALNVVHTKYVLGIELNVYLFIVPILAGIIFGYATAKIRTSYKVPIYQSDVRIYLKYIFLSCLVTSALNVIHTEWVLERNLELTLFVAPVIAGVFFGYLLAHIKTLNNKLVQLATTDMLTEACNRMHFESLLKIEINKVQRYGGTFSIIFFDVDKFKNINDEYGHQAGDKVLEELSKLIRSRIRVTDVFSRYGGEEFIIMSTATGLEGATIFANSLCDAIQKHTFTNVGTVTCSFGVVEYDEKSIAASLINTADKALYKAKEKGRNCVESILNTA